ncbi:MAG: hypothetical protein DHS20C02_03170 [Micavibrio sp.]|nr:MAG: hypothetical protein DHS20C02_03170 [Micavibrio sp.]
MAGPISGLGAQQVSFAQTFRPGSTSGQASDVSQDEIKKGLSQNSETGKTEFAVGDNISGLTANNDSVLDFHKDIAQELQSSNPSGNTEEEPRGSLLDIEV